MTAAPKSAKLTDELLRRALKVRQEGKSWKQVAEAVGLSADAYLAGKVKERYGAEAVAPKPKAPAKPEPAAKRKAAARKRTVKTKVRTTDKQS